MAEVIPYTLYPVYLVTGWQHFPHSFSLFWGTYSPTHLLTHPLNHRSLCYVVLCCAMLCYICYIPSFPKLNNGQSFILPYISNPLPSLQFIYTVLTFLMIIIPYIMPFPSLTLTLSMTTTTTAHTIDIDPAAQFTSARICECWFGLVWSWKL